MCVSETQHDNGSSSIWLTVGFTHMMEIVVSQWWCGVPSIMGWRHSGLLAWWRHQMELFSALLTLCAGNSTVTVEFPAQRPVTRSFDVFFDLCLSKRLSKQSWGWWFETPLRPWWRNCNGRGWHQEQVSFKKLKFCGGWVACSSMSKQWSHCAHVG